MILALTAWALWPGRRRYVATGWLWYLVALLPVSGVLQVGDQAMADRYAYLPLIGVFAAVSWGGRDLLAGGEGRRLRRVAAAVIIGEGFGEGFTAWFDTSDPKLQIASDPGRQMEGAYLKGLLAQASTGLSVGGIRQQFSHPSNIRLSQMTLEFCSNPPQEFDPPGDFHRVGYLFLTRERRTWQGFQANVRLQREHGVPVELLSRDEIARRWPFLETRDLRGGTFVR